MTETVTPEPVTPGAATPKQMARRLRAELAARGLAIGHSEALELVAHQWGARDWNTLAARQPGAGASPGASAVSPGAAVPILRIFDRAKAVEFYVDYLGFRLDWENGGQHDHSPLYAQVSRGAAVLHLSEHHGDASPGGAALIPVADVDALHDELHTREYDFARPGVSAEEWGRVMVVIDPFHNRIVFHEPPAAAVEPRPSEAAAPIELASELTVPPEVAFDAFTQRIGEWWHEAYSPGGLVGLDTGGAVGARVTMALADGTTYPWGTVTVWDPPHRYAQTFTLAQDTENPSTLDVRFEPRAGGGCTVRFAHGGWTAGNLADRARFTEWDILLGRFAAVAEGREVPPVPRWVTGEEPRPHAT
ncbi:glyoxalase superfamily protein [Cellulomonas alba]|uniref:Bleomycin resistance protein n=1 Tax=Cellulomonas alba TaxID=3053467 RepID=A0ABT7SEZ1_9CELL|nr:glyoxalase superfamily protein [Cellulomonas alba]MDM7854758.1 glyoxalase superfamily protein [Cellulomonas alba]